MIEPVTQGKKKPPPFVNFKCLCCGFSLRDLVLYERSKCKKCKSFFFLIRAPKKFFILS